MRLMVLLVAAGLLWSPPVFADYVSGNELYKECTADIRESPGDIGLCAGYVEGLADAHGLDGTTCIPQGVSVGQVKDVIVKYLTQNPELRHFGASLLGFAALAQAFPCKK